VDDVNDQVEASERYVFDAWTWSYSRFARYLECQESYRLHYIERRRVTPLTRLPFLQGNVAHKLLARTWDRFQSGEVSSLAAAVDDIENVFQQHAVAIHWQSDDDVIKARLEARQLVTNYLALLDQVGIGRERTENVRCEYSFGTYKNPLERSSGLRWAGAIDWLVLDPPSRSAVIYDAKSSISMAHLDRRQLVMYAMAVEQIFNVEVTQVGYLMLRWGQPRMETITAAEKATLEDEMVKASRAVEAQAFTTSPTKGCLTCGYSNGHACTHFDHWIISSGSPAGEVEW
jgi:hypothetical protein